MPLAVLMGGQPTKSKVPAFIEPFLLDTGAALTILSADAAKEHGLTPFKAGGTVGMSTRLGSFKGHMVPCRFVVEGHAGKVEWTGEAWVSDLWPGPSVLGMKGGLEHLKTCLDPRNGLASFALSR